MNPVVKPVTWEESISRMPKVELPVFPDQQFDITEYGAVGDGAVSNTEAINRAIEVCSQAGGGRVIIPAGIWLTGPIHMRSNVDLHAAKGALVVFSSNFDEYPLIVSAYEGLRTVRCTSPLTGENLENIAITGEGVFDGSGDAWRPVKKWKMTDRQWDKLVASGGVVEEGKESPIWWPTAEALEGQRRIGELLKSESKKVEDFQPIRDYLRPVLLSFRNCRKVLLDGPVFQNSPSWNLHPWVCEHLTVRNVTVRNPWYAQNGDGIDVESCRYVQIVDSHFDVGDDAICMKSGKNEDGRRLGKPCEYVTVSNCTVYHGHGGFVIGSEMSGGVQHVWVSDCTFIGTDVGLRFKSTRGRGGVVQDIHIRNIRMKDIVGEAITFNMYYEKPAGDEKLKQPVTEETPVFKDIYISDTVCVGAKQAIQLKGLPEMPIENIHISHVTMTSEKGIDCAFAKDIHIQQAHIVPAQGDVVTVRESTAVTLDGRSLC
jgi:polygalacturonase